MADHFYGLNIGAGVGTGVVTFSTLTGGQHVELRVRDGVAGLQGNKTELLKAIEKIEYDIATRAAPV